MPDHEVCHVTVKRFVEIAATQHGEFGVELLQHLFDLGVAVARGQRIGQATGVAVQGALVFLVLFQLDVIVHAVGDGQCLHGLTSGAVDLFQESVELNNRVSGLSQQIRHPFLLVGGCLGRVFSFVDGLIFGPLALFFLLGFGLLQTQLGSFRSQGF